MGWESIGILAPDPALIDNTPVLRRYRTRGLMVTARSAELSTPRSLEGFTGPLVAYRPDAPTLELAEAVSGAGGIVAVSGNNDWLSSWITAHQPAHLAGARLDPARP
ncbi:hypothetical protein GCM10011374_36790 [Kocuria dechangensis]|uniref:Uncharacterized protein n=1 Tax=Kocuria dechangensis TaxID=1176249 RepID=A0A917H7G7_9MICC|nr:hypothetical protein [Kocuria dechangensis]GGG68997.1 hypothetical protein GCM10011374_36790 [Kocuria dechangensis]